ncbi:MAG: nucleoside-diphosphate kinase [Candidatus Acetothermia bacterium]|jgi:nucleoside-diphosphate kinase|nr:nucleoside-diphosphate kinase [Candidatus Acetothermia bacterium]MDH7504664.1 nucleoside-diphosphate kinase [Candidatus Acetothermia bacterium]
MVERTFVMLKPDGVQRGLVGEIISRLERKGLKIVALKMIHLDRALAERQYEVHRGKHFFNELVEFVTSSPVVALVVEGEEAIKVVRKLMGATNPFEAEPGSIRGDFGLDLTKNLIHGSDSAETAKREIALFFREEELLDYDLSSEAWM